MSTKTTFKRISLVVVAALGFGVVAAVPSSAAASATTFTFTNGTAITTTPKVGSVVKVPISAAQAGSADAIATGTLIATVTTKPTNSTLAAESTTVSIDAADGVTFSNAKITLESTSAVAGSAGAKITLTAAADATSAAAAPAAVFGFTPDVAGYYIVTFTKGGTGGTTFTANTVGVNVSGAALVQAATGLGKSTGTQINGRPSAAAFFLPAASSTASRYEVSATGAGIVGIFALSSLADAASATTSTSVTVGDFEVFPKSPKTLRKVLDPHGIHIHSLRHTYAYILKSQGIHVTTAQKLMGHSDPKITMAIYTRVLDDEIDNAGAILRRMTS